MPGCGLRSRGVRDSPADRRAGEKKSFCCVTTRRRNLGILNGLGRGLDPLTARFLGLGVPGFGLVGLAMLGLPPCRLPLADPPQAFRFPAVALVPAPRLVLAATPFAQALPRTRSAPSGRTATFSLTLTRRPWEVLSPKGKLGEDVQPSSLSAIKTQMRRSFASLSPSREQDREQNGLSSAPRKETQESIRLQ